MPASTLNSRIISCPKQGNYTKFQLIDEFGDGTPYAGLAWEAMDCEGQRYAGKLDAQGNGQVDNHYCGPLLLSLTTTYRGVGFYQDLLTRPHYPLPITELQVRAEHTLYANSDGHRTHLERANGPNESFLQVEVRDLVRHAAHLPPKVKARFSTTESMRATICHAPAVEHLSLDPAASPLVGVALAPNKRHILEVRPLRALRPIISADRDFCALNLYQLAVMATLSYSPFGQSPSIHPIATKAVLFPLQPSSGNWFGDALAKYQELWQVDAAQANGTAYYPLLEEVPYSKRLEIVPFDPDLYPDVNGQALEEDQETPAKLHFLDDIEVNEGTNTQAFITHNDEIILVSVRGTAEKDDILRDINAEQVHFVEGMGKAHKGFYEAAQAAFKFAIAYMDKFYSDQKLILTGHSLGGAVALLLAEMLRRRADGYDIILYTYGAPRAGDSDFIEGASELVHHRTVNHNDPVPGVPAAWMDTRWDAIKTTLRKGPKAGNGIGIFVLGLINWHGKPYGHHGTLRHFMPVTFEDGRTSSILWNPGCETITEQACTRALEQIDGLPERGNFVRQIFNASDHMMVASYIPNCWSTLRRWQEALQSKGSLITEREFDRVDRALIAINHQLNTDHSRERPYQQTQRLQMDALLRAERQNVELTRQRLSALRSMRPSETDVYGDVAAKPEVLAAVLARWHAHPENTTAQQLAMAPPLVISDEEAIATLIGGHVIGAPYTFDIDSIS